ncbi:hypothetical protein GXW82_20745 [Streptacidiphilus sp. 4-A2]|nr:hypothetical protein [Streptacidiphilus sp. 4-A2]
MAELAASPIADHLRLIVLGSAAPLVGRVGIDRVRTREQPEQALADLVAHRSSLEDALTECQISHPRAARSQGVATDTWVSVLLCTDQALNQEQLDELGWVLAGREHRCIAAVTPAAQGAGWRLDARPGHYRIASNLPFAVELQRMSESDFAAALSVLETSQLPPSDLPPDWTGHFSEPTQSEPAEFDPTASEPDGSPDGMSDGSPDAEQRQQSEEAYTAPAADRAGSTSCRTRPSPPCWRPNCTRTSPTRSTSRSWPRTPRRWWAGTRPRSPRSR